MGLYRGCIWVCIGAVYGSVQGPYMGLYRGCIWVCTGALFCSDAVLVHLWTSSVCTSLISNGMCLFFSVILKNTHGWRHRKKNSMQIV